MPAQPPSELDLLQQAALFHNLPAADLAVLAEQARTRTQARGGFFFHQGDPATALYLLTAGHVRLTQITPEGHQVVIRFVSPGQIFGEIAALGEAVYPAGAEAVGDCSALAWDAPSLAALLERSPRLALNLVRHLAGRVQDLQDRLRELATERVEQRVARALLRLVRQTGRRVEGGVLIDFALSRQDLAQMTGATLYTVSRILSRWEEEGIVASGRTRILVRVPHRLVALAEDLPPPPPPKETG
ncbi:MAG: Crp/Fnr family transcriptional regulator [Chloroflexi bacterium]|nr:MAG: Crp/Fnr family transcriptional regulator [Chloroflexota bacterium]